MTKRKRCPICNNLFAPQGFKKHLNWCMRKDAALSSLPPEPAQNVPSQSIEPALDTDSTFESIVKELEDANLGLMIVILD